MDLEKISKKLDALKEKEQAKYPKDPLFQRNFLAMHGEIIAEEFLEVLQRDLYSIVESPDIQSPHKKEAETFVREMESWIKKHILDTASHYPQ